MSQAEADLLGELGSTREQEKDSGVHADGVRLVPGSRRDQFRALPWQAGVWWIMIPIVVS